MQIEKTEVRITCDKPLEGDERTVRGFFGDIYRNSLEICGYMENLIKFIKIFQKQCWKIIITLSPDRFDEKDRLKNLEVKEKC